MQRDLVLLLLFCLLMAGVSFYLGFIRPPRVVAWLSQAAFLVFTFMLAPILVYVLWQQGGAVERLEALGFAAHPSIVEAVGIANGVGERPVWLFRASDEAAAVLDFYRRGDKRRDWTLKTDGGSMLIFTRSGEKVTVAASQRGGHTSLMFSYSPGESSPDKDTVGE